MSPYFTESSTTVHHFAYSLHPDAAQANCVCLVQRCQSANILMLIRWNSKNLYRFSRRLRSHFARRCLDSEEEVGGSR